jgi:flagellar motor switch protein FliN/FliY
MADDTPDEDDVEAEMMRMMQEELSGDDSSETDQDDDLAQMATALGGSEDAGNIDEMLEQEMLKAMQTESGGSSEGSPDQLAAYGEATQASETPEGIERLAGIDVNVTVELGSASVEIRDIMKWTSDSIVELEAQESDLVDIMVNGILFARGEVVVVADTFGVRILELVNPSIEPSFRRE